MAKILFINGSPNENGCTATAMNEMAVTLEKEGVETERNLVRKKCRTGLYCLYEMTRKQSMCISSAFPMKNLPGNWRHPLYPVGVEEQVRHLNG